MHLEKQISNARSNLVRADGQNEEMLAMFDGITSCLATVAIEIAKLRVAIEEKGEEP
ncbi:hypothetical protein [Novosphingobium humi]|uniref:hypothetical protein n=1 Tax=Novosphingobium humi TaxID=2282397 RepID=UPI0025AF55F3|nr:hypothetical protein [Novosphingobium humi]WJS98199.1 hypothetical protein NYQ05_13850 [Novosphingobium humi]